MVLLMTVSFCLGIVRQSNRAIGYGSRTTFKLGTHTMHLHPRQQHLLTTQRPVATNNKRTRRSSTTSDRTVSMKLNTFLRRLMSCAGLDTKLPAFATVPSDRRITQLLAP